MKTLILTTTLLFNPLNTIQVQEDNNQLITTASGLNKTNAANTYTTFSYENSYQTQVTQKFDDKTTSNNYAYTEIYNYCNLNYIINRNSDQDHLIYNTFVIIQYTPYKYIQDSSINLHISLNQNMFDDNGGYDGMTANLTYTLATTTTDMQSLLNVSNWSNYGNAEPTGIYWQTAYTNNTNKYTVQHEETRNIEYFDDPSDYYTIIANNVLLATNTTTYIILQIHSDMYWYAQGNWRYPIAPNEYTRLLNTSMVQITSNLAPIVVNEEIVDIPGLMFTILSLPFSFISQAFDLTIFPGTPYQVNFSNIFLGFIAIAMLLWVLKLIIGQADIGQWLGDQKRMHREERLRDKNHKMQMQQERNKYKRARELENQRSAANLNRTAQHNSNRHIEQVAAEKAAHERAMKHNGRR